LSVDSLASAARPYDNCEDMTALSSPVLPYIRRFPGFFRQAFSQEQYEDEDQYGALVE
jgi:hypothetical protein